MRLYFLRHGLADRSDWSGDDFERPLTGEGRQRMERSARTLERMGLELDRILTSPLTRARQTAEIVASRLGRRIEEDDRLAGGFGPWALEAIIAPFDASERIMLVGHEPSLSDTIGELIGGGQVICKKGSLARVDLFSTRPPRGQLVWMMPPAVLALKR